MRIDIRDYKFDGRTYWVAVVDGGTVSVACTFLKALWIALDGIVEALLLENEPEGAFVARPCRCSGLPERWTAWEVHAGAYVLVDDNGYLLEVPELFSRRTLSDYLSTLFPESQQAAEVGGGPRPK